VCEIKDDEIIIADSKTKDLVLKRPLEKIEFYRLLSPAVPPSTNQSRFDKTANLFYFIAQEYHTRFCHVFQDQNCDEGSVSAIAFTCY